MRIKFSLRTSMILVALCALLCATILPAVLERQRMKRLSKPGVQLITEPRGQFFLRQLAGDSLSQRVVYVHLDSPEIDDEWLERLLSFSAIEVISIRSENVTDRGLKYLERLPNLTSLDLVNTRTTEGGVANLRSTSKKLKRVAIATLEPINSAQ